MARVIGPKHGVHGTHANGNDNSSPDDNGDTGVSAGVGLQLGPGPVDLNPVTSIAGQATQDRWNFDVIVI
ncbi:hypothetical protein H0H93_016843 [Arthromyces matolae]|nr:hypothetical protein H0H93_016843 [Arthromyces matolae]